MSSRIRSFSVSGEHAHSKTYVDWIIENGVTKVAEFSFVSRCFFRGPGGWELGYRYERVS